VEATQTINHSRRSLMPDDYLSHLGITPAMSRLQSLVNPDTLGETFFTPTQADMRAQLGQGFDGGKQSYQADPSKKDSNGNARADNNVVQLTRHPDGTASSVRLEATADGWIETGGQTPRDFKVVNW
jgi:hypothetical protein